MAVVRILGIDPGTQVVGFGCLEFEVAPEARAASGTPLALRGGNVVRIGGGVSTNELRLLEAGVFRLGGRDTSIANRLLSLAEQFRDLLARLRPDEVALEEAFAGKSPQAALRIGEARGVVLAESARGGLLVHQFAPARVKRCVTGNGAASKEAVAAMVGNLVAAARVAPQAALPKDATDAVAVAFTRVEQRRSPLAMAAAIDADVATQVAGVAIAGTRTSNAARGR